MISGDRSILSGKKGAFWYTLEELSKYWERIDVVCPWQLQASRPNGHSSGRASFKLQAFFRNVFFHPSPHGLWYQPLWIRKCGGKLVGEFGHEVMTVHDYPPFYNGIGARMLLKRFKLRSVLEIHHIVGWPRAASISECFACVLSRIFLPTHAGRFDAIRTVSRSIGEELLRWGIPPEKVRIVPSFYLDRELLRPDPSIRKQYDLVFSGRLVPNKGLPSLLRALAGLPGVSLLVIGDGPERATMERLTQKLGFSERVRFFGWLPNMEAVIRAMQMARVFVLPSSSEGGPRIVLEAMAVGMPVIATKVGVLPEVIQDGVNGIFTDGTSTDLRKKIDALLLDEKKRHEISAQAVRIVEKFERVKLIRGYAEFLKGVRCQVSGYRC